MHTLLFSTLNCLSTDFQLTFKLLTADFNFQSTLNLFWNDFNCRRQSWIIFDSLSHINVWIQTSQQIHDLEEKRICFIKLEETKSKEKKFKSTSELEREKSDSKWCTSKIREELCLIHEAYQFFRLKYKKRYGTCIPSPNKFMK